MDIAAVAETVSRDCSCTLPPEVINIANGVSARDPGPIPVRIPSRFSGRSAPHLLHHHIAPNVSS